MQCWQLKHGTLGGFKSIFFFFADSFESAFDFPPELTTAALARPPDEAEEVDAWSFERWRVCPKISLVDFSVKLLLKDSKIAAMMNNTQSKGMAFFYVGVRRRGDLGFT
jgi:hypothetical protein